MRRPAGSDRTWSTTSVADRRRTWRPQLAVIGAEGLPVPANAGATLLPSTSLKLSLRLPPMLDSNKAMALMTETLTDDPPYGAEVKWDPLLPNNTGWNAPELATWLEDSVKRAGQAAFGQPMAFMGEGGTIPAIAAIISAVENALAPFGVIIAEAPITPQRIVELLGEHALGRTR